ncbi:MAG TPA: hypothetical protein VMF67_07100 [Rhizomicrobium sp.]|nr:hypothetical protein [Rhizomicrobium sp.]
MCFTTLATARAKGPQFGDPLELRGEALLYAGRRDAARAQFEAATNLTPAETSERAADLARL